MSHRVAVVGATGAVGTVMLEKLRERGFPAREIVPFASARSAGRELAGFGTVQPLTDETIQGFDLAIFSAGRRPRASGRSGSSRRAASSSTTPRAGAATRRSRSWSARSTRTRSSATAG